MATAKTQSEQFEQVYRAMQARVSRRSLFKIAGATGLGLTLSTGLLGKGPLLRETAMMRAVAQSDEDIQTIIDIAVTAEAMAVTLIGGAIASAEAGNYNQEIPELVVEILKAARAEEQFHYEYLTEAGATPLTTTFTIPDPALLTDYNTLFSTVVTLDTAFVAAYMTAATRFAELGQPELVKVAYQIAGVEAEHRVLANYALGVRPANNYGFYPNLFSTVGEAAAALQELGFIGGTGTQVSYPGPGEIDASNVMNTEPGGPSATCDVPMTPVAGDTVLIAPLTPDQEVPGPGDPDAFGFAKVYVRPSAGEVCVRLSVALMEPPTGAHIHEAPRGEAGPVVVPLPLPEGGLVDGCVSADVDLLTDIANNPENYYVNIHTASYPAGAVRGQLTRQ